MIAGRLTQDGDLKLGQSIDTRLPLVTNGLVAHYPFDGSTKGIGYLNKIDYSTWTIGTTGSQVGFNQNGTSSENSIVEDIGPFGEPQAIWQALGNDVASDPDGGWDGSSFTIDRTKKYRFSVWIRRKVAGNGTGYFGCATNSSVYNIVANTVNTNPYFWSGGTPSSDWRLYVAYIYPSDIGNVYPVEDAGIYNLQKVKLGATGSFKFSPTATTTYLRTYLYYSTLAETNQQWAYPRVDLCDGTEPSLDDLLSGEGNVTNPVTDTSNTKTFNGVAIESATTNIIPYGDFSNGLRQPYLSAANGALSIVYDNTLGRNVLRHTNSSGAESYFSSSNFALTPSIAGDTWTNTVYVRSETVGASVQMYIFELNSSNAYVQIPQKTIIVNPWDGWVKLSLTYTFINAATVNIGTRLDLDNNGTVYYRDWQLEKKASATEYVNGSRGTGYLQYSSKSINPSVGTFHFETYIYPELYSTTGYIDMLDFITSSNNRFLILRKSANNVIPETMFLRDGSTYRTINTIPYIIQNAWNSFTWVWDTTSGYSMYINNTLVASGVTYTISDLPSDFFRFSYSWIIKNLSIYNRALSAGEIKTLAKGTHSITSDTLITKSIEVKPITPTDSFYFPLDLNGKDSMNSVIPTQSTSSFSTGDVYVIGGTALEYNLNTSIGLDWNANWSICYFKKPIGTHLGEANLTGYNLESLGCNSNTIGGGYIFWGKETGVNSLYQTTNSDITPSVYFQNWQCVTMVKSGTNLTIETWMNDKLQRTRTITYGTIASNYYVTQHGYDLKLGGWDNGNECWSYYKHLTILKRAMTAQELLDFRKTKMSASKNGLRIQSSASTYENLV
jgi:hypothetical protein